MLSSSFSLDGPKGDNQDRVLDPVTVNHAWVAAIADGVGGNLGGAIAAKLAVEAIREVAAGEAGLSAAFSLACERIAKAASERPDLARMATTLSAIRVRGSHAEVSHVGDTRIYHIRGSGLLTRTTDQTEVAQLVKQGVLTASQARNYPRRNVITSYLSSSATYEIFETEFSVKAGDLIVLLSDGVYEQFKKHEFISTWTSHPSVDSFATELKNRLEMAGTRDDSSMISIQV